MAGELSSLQRAQLTVAEANVRLDLLTEAVGFAMTELGALAEEALARREHDLCERALTAAEEVSRKARGR